MTIITEVPEARQAPGARNWVLRYLDGKGVRHASTFYSPDDAIARAKELGLKADLSDLARHSFYAEDSP